MPASSGPNLGLLVHNDLGAAYYAELTRLLRGLDALVMPRVKDKDLATPPGSPVDGDSYIVAASPTGAWSGQAGKIARWSTALDPDAWEFFTPKEGWRVALEDEDVDYRHNGTAWVLQPIGSEVEDAIVDGVTARAPSQNAVFDALALKVAKTGDTMTGPLYSSSVIQSTSTMAGNAFQAINGTSGYAQGYTGDANTTGYFSWHQSNGTRAAYLGNANSTVKEIQFVFENGYKLVITGASVSFDRPIKLPQTGPGVVTGNATLVGGTVTVSTTAATANAKIVLTRKTAGGTLGNTTYTITVGTSFTITSDNALDTSTFTWLIIEGY